MKLASIAAALVALSSTGSAQPLPKVTVGDNPSLSGAPLYIALEKGYYREAGVDVQLDMSGTSSDMAVMLATNRLNVIGGAISAGFFNSIAKDLPVALMFSRAVSPFAHHLMIRPDLKDTLKSPADLKGRTVAIAARGAILIYELVKVLEAGGLTLNDVDIKYIPFGQQPTALTNKAVDAALMISPLQDSVAAKGIGIKWINADDFIKVQPVVISVWMMNTDWAKANEDAARKFVRATLRGVRDYCNAYHRGPNRGEVTRILTKYSNVKDAALIDRIDWGAADPQGRIAEASVMDVQATFLKEKLTRDQVTFARIAPAGWIADVAASLGPFTPAADSGAKGCR
ncbi:MAG: ABC transporter substrate-binding protein [Xanthobacteraceae bacterium]|nr:ABC transporter substrate-binding protein [Xanthobacteraceae bacterium]